MKKKNKGIPRHLLVALSLAVFGSFIGCQKSQDDSGNGMGSKPTQEMDQSQDNQSNWYDDAKDGATDKAQPSRGDDDDQGSWGSRDDDDKDAWMKKDDDDDKDSWMNPDDTDNDDGSNNGNKNMNYRGSCGGCSN